MGKKKTAPPPWMGYLQGILLALGIYLGGLLLMALLVVRGSAPENAAFPVTAALCVLGTACGGWQAARRSSLGPLPASLLAAILFAAVLAGMGLLLYHSLTWSGRGGVVLLCALAGGILGGLLGSRRSRRRKKRSL